MAILQQNAKERFGHHFVGHEYVFRLFYFGNTRKRHTKIFLFAVDDVLDEFFVGKAAVVSVV